MLKYMLWSLPHTGANPLLGQSTRPTLLQNIANMGSRVVGTGVVPGVVVTITVAVVVADDVICCVVVCIGVCVDGYASLIQ